MTVLRFNILSNVYFLLVLLKGVWNLQMSPNQKIGAYAIFTVGIISVYPLLFIYVVSDLVS